VPEALVIDVAAIEVRRRRWDAQVRIGPIAAGDVPIRVDCVRLLRHGRQRRLFARCRLLASSGGCLERRLVRREAEHYRFYLFR
jgi:hypothetical protein